MSASDSHCSIDWLASANKDRDGLFQSQHEANEIPSSVGRPDRSPHPSPPCQRPQSPKGMETTEDKLVARKCSELQCYIHPLASILSGLQSGRYRERLSTFQESVAMDRIQRIMGVLQNRCIGPSEKYVAIVLKVEKMLKNWFPHVRPREQHVTDEKEETPPFKKLKLSPASTSSSSDSPQLASYSTTNLKIPSAEPSPTQDSAVSSSTDARPCKPPAKINAPCLERLLKSTESIVACRPQGRDSSRS